MSEECERSFNQPDVTVYSVIPISYILDGKRVKEPVDQTAIQIVINYQVVVGHPIVKSELDRCFDRTGILQEYRPLAAEALATVLLEEHEREVGCALIRMGATITTLAVYHENVLQNLLVVPLGAENITKDIEELGISEINAERLKCLKGCALESLVEEPVYIQVTAAELGSLPVKISTQFLATIIEARLEEIMQPIFDAIENLPFELEAGIVLTGGGAKLNNIGDFITEKTGVDTRLGNHSDWLSADTDQKFHDSKYAQMLGTVLLTHEYRKDHPLVEVIEDPKKKTKLPKGSYLGGKLTGLFTNYFGEESENKF
jgi:cell division protein FtsA